MQRTLRVSPRPFVIIATILLPFVAVVGYACFLREWVFAAKTLGCLVVVAVFLASQLYFLFVRVDEEKIAIHGWLGEKARVYFRDITCTRTNVLIEQDYPVSIDIFCADSDSPAMVIMSKTLRQSDVAWLLSLPALRLINEDSAQPEVN